MSGHREDRPRRAASRGTLRLRPPSPRPAVPALSRPALSRPASARPASRRPALSRPVSSPAPPPASLPLAAPAGLTFTGVLLARLASATSASASCSSRGRDTSLARIAALSVTFIAGTSSSSSRQCHPKDPSAHRSADRFATTRRGSSPAITISPRGPTRLKKQPRVTGSMFQRSGARSPESGSADLECHQACPKPQRSQEPRKQQKRKGRSSYRGGSGLHGGSGAPPYTQPAAKPGSTTKNLPVNTTNGTKGMHDGRNRPMGAS